MARRRREPERRFELPGIQDLSKEQDEARARPREGQHLVVGGPGTGKSILALIRARRHHRDRDDYVFLVYNHLLHRACGQLFGDDLSSSTWITWFHGVFRDLTGEPAPRLPAERAGGFEHTDWKGVADIIEALPSSTSFKAPFLVIDEGQDMPPEFYTSLIDLGFEHFFVVADQNQQIRDQNSSRRELQDCLGIETSEVMELDLNYRNRYRVARLAREFYTGDPASPPPQLPAPGRGSTPQLWSYAPENFDGLVKRILRLADRDPSRLIGVMAPNHEVRQRYFDALRRLVDTVALDHEPPLVETHFSGKDPSEVSFDRGGILVINAQACKGLEFDVAMLADIDKHIIRRDDPDRTRRLFYVMVARAREQVFLFMQKGASRAIEEILPRDVEVLQRRDL